MSDGPDINIIHHTAHESLRLREGKLLPALSQLISISLFLEEEGGWELAKQ